MRAILSTAQNRSLLDWFESEENVKGESSLSFSPKALEAEMPNFIPTGKIGALTVAFATAAVFMPATGSQAGVINVVDKEIISQPTSVHQVHYWRHYHVYYHHWRHRHHWRWRRHHYWHYGYWRPCCGYYPYYGYYYPWYNPVAPLVGGLAAWATAPLFGWW